MSEELEKFDGIPSPDSLRKLVKEYEDKVKENHFHDILLLHREDIITRMIDAASHGRSYIFTEKLENISNYDINEDLDELKDYLKNKIQIIFGDALGFKVDYLPAYNYFKISWEE